VGSRVFQGLGEPLLGVTIADMHPIQQRGLRLPFASISSFAAGFAVSVVSGIVIENWVGVKILAILNATTLVLVFL